MNTHAYLNGCKVGHFYEEFYLNILRTFAAFKYSQRVLKTEFSDLTGQLHRIWKVR